MLHCLCWLTVSSVTFLKAELSVLTDHSKMDEEVVQAAVAPMFGVLDIVLLAGMAGFGIYWVYFRGSSKPQPPPSKGYTMQ